MILESVYEPIFSNNSHGFRPNMSCHTALKSLKREFSGVSWFIEGDIKGCFDNIDHRVLANVINAKIKDARLIQLIWKFLKAGYMEDWQYHATYSGCPQGGIVSPILANIYLNELDKFVEKTAKEFYKSRDRHHTPEYDKVTWQIKKAQKQLKTATGQGKTALLQKIAQLKLQGHWIIEMSEMLATSSAKSIEEIRSFISRQKETYRTPYESQPKDRLRQCVFGGSSNTLDFLPLDRAGNRRFLPIMIYPENAEVHILEDEDASRAYLLQVWAETMSIYRSGNYSMKFSKTIQHQLVEVQKDFMPEDTEAGQIQGFLERYTGNMVCSKQLFKEALGHTFDEPKRWQLHNINEIMNTVVTGWKPFSNPRMFAGYGRQKGWERDAPGNELPGNEGGFVELNEEECRQLELPKEWIA